MKCNYGKHKKRSNDPSKSAEVTPITPELLKEMKSVKKAYREAVKTLHPDVNPAPNAATLFRMSKEAYERILAGQPPS